MDKITLLRELNKSTIEKDIFERALEASGIELPPEEDMDSLDMDGEAMPDEEIGDEFGDEVADDELDTEMDSESPLDDDELQDIVDWCEEECADLSDEEIRDTLIDELEELELSPEELNATIDQVMSTLGHGAEDEIGDEYSDELDSPEIDNTENPEDELPPEDFI